MWWMAAAAAASEPQIEVLDDGTVRGTVDVAASPDELRALVLEPIDLNRITAEESTVTVAPAEQAGCTMVTVATPHPIMPVTYTSRDCRTAKGVKSVLVQSKQLTHLAAQWTVEAAGAGSRVVFDLDVKTNVPVPSFITRRSTKKSVKEALTALQRSFAAR